MTLTKTSLFLALTSAIALGACADNGLNGTPADKTRNGALIGAGTGALIGALSKGDGNRAEGALKGAALGGALGAGIGYSLDRQEADLRAQVGNSNISIVNTGDRLIVTLPQDILFATDSFAVNPGLRGDLRAVAQNLQKYPNSTVQVIGHTDSDGEAAYNQGLSERRASAVSQILLSEGVGGARVQSIGRGESQPVDSNLSASGKARNRRVEIVILPNAQT